MLLLCPLNILSKKQRFACRITVKNRQLSTVPLNFDCSLGLAVNGNSTTVAFGSESVKYAIKSHSAIASILLDKER